MPQFSTNSPLSSFIPIGLIMVFNLLFEMVADLRRHAEDKKANLFKVQVATYKHGVFQHKDMASEKLKVGNLIKLRNEEWVPADCLIV